ncbi:hypothetical protein Q8791_23210 [Nocardiopsis sp. CT-R113]|uniref:Lipoprotein n=1 Tax=Nocardiopsis codii TaxID=3065942 RepID=A0ABU7KD20_9ACTN|nr:hypothetical protein [Nocardiopsis sp. CT-R113]MEE2040131.1 hypothetical protein [Nocardiopsis sp. CT-R113]
MRARKTAAGAVLVVAAVAGCAPESGEVVGRDYTAPYTWVEQQCTTVTQPNGGSAAQVCTPVTRYEDESYSLRLDDGESAGWREVSEHDHAVCHVGDLYPACARERGGR